MKNLILLAIPLFLVTLAFSPFNGFKVTGKITDSNGHALVGVTVKVRGSSSSTTSAADGQYSIDAIDRNSVLVFSYIGFISREEKMNGRSVINISLAPVKQKLREVVVTAYSPARKNVGVRIVADAMPSGSVPEPEMIEDKKPDPGYYKMDSNERDEDFNTEGYDRIVENPFLKVSDNPLSTFSIDVDAASYSNVRRYLNMGQLPPAGAVRIEEMINYFHYHYPAPEKDLPFSINTELSECPWNVDHKLVLVGLQGKKIPVENLPPSNIVFLIDVSGSMMEPEKLPLVQASMKMLVDQLREQDHVALVVYAGSAGLVLPPTSGSEKMKIKDAIDRLEAGGSTAGGAGIKLAYKVAKENFLKEGNNRVILCTDGDFNIGASSDDEMERLIEKERESGVFLTVLGYGMGNYKDNKMQKLADKGNGNHAYIDGISEARKVLVNEFGGTLFTIAKDVKLQIEFNPAIVQGYRLIGYENRVLNKEDFNNDKKDAGDLGSGHTVTALYEIIPAGVETGLLDPVDPLKYQPAPQKPSFNDFEKNEVMNIKLRYKQPSGDVSRLIEHPLANQSVAFKASSDNFRFAAAVAEFGMLLRNSAFKSDASFENVLKLARKAKGEDEEGYRAEFIKLVENARSLASHITSEKQELVSVDNE